MELDDIPADVQIMLKQHDWLRDEIDQSNELQNRIAFAQAILVGLGLGLKAMLTASKQPIGDLLGIGILALPVLIATSTSVWLLEQARVMRAGNYLQYLEDQVNQRMDSHPLSWESWLRSTREERSEPAVRGLDRIRNPHRVYNSSFIIGYPLYFVTLSLVAFYLVYQLQDKITLPDIMIWGIAGGALAVNLGLATVSYFQIDHNYHNKSNGFGRFDSFLKDTFEQSGGACQDTTSSEESESADT